ncbi:MAG: hypothetical protein AB8G77_06475 [Rhodothermales bacterium]
MQDTHLRWMLAVLVSLLMLIGFLFFYPNASNPTASPHPVYSSILQSTGPYDTFASWIGVLFGLLLIATIYLTMAIGLFRPQHKSTLKAWVLRATLIYGLVWISIKLVYDVYLTNPEPAFFGGFPIPTALLLYGMGSFPLFLIPLYYYYFSKDVYSDEDQQRFEQIMKDNALENGGNHA